MNGRKAMLCPVFIVSHSDLVSCQQKISMANIGNKSFPSKINITGAFVLENARHGLIPTRTTNLVLIVYKKV